MRRSILLALAAASLVACATPFTGVIAPHESCRRAYQDADAFITVCYAKCPPDMEQYARVMGQGFGYVAAC